MFSSLVGASDHEGAHTKAGIYFASPSPLAEATSRGFKGWVPFKFPFIFLFLLFWELDIKD